MPFDARAAKLLSAGKYMLIDECPGLRLVATAARKTWTYRYKEVGGQRMKQIAIGHWPSMSLGAAIAQWHILREQRSSGVKPEPQRKQRVEDGKANALTVARVMREYIDGQLIPNRGADTASCIAAQRMLERHTKQIATMSAADVTRSLAFDTIHALRKTPTAAARLGSLLGAVWDYSLDAGRLPESTPNHWRSVMKGRLKSRGKIIGGKHVGQTRRVLSADEVRLLLGWVAAMHRLGRDSVVMYLWTVTRGCEFLAMRPEHVAKERDGWWWTVPKAATKNARSPFAVDQRVPLFGDALEVVLRRLDAVGESGWLFEDVRGEQYTQHDFSTYVYNLMPYSVKQGSLRCPVTNWTPHNLRRTARTMLSTLGCSCTQSPALRCHQSSGGFRRSGWRSARRCCRCMAFARTSSAGMAWRAVWWSCLLFGLLRQ